MNSRLGLIPQSATVALADMVREMSASGERILGLQTGDPDYNTPTPITEAARRAIEDGYTHYCASRGLHQLRRAIADNMEEGGALFSPDSEILVCNGGVHAMHCAFAALLESGDEVLVPDPGWMTYSNTVLMHGATPVPIPSFPEDCFVPKIKAIEDGITEATRAIVVNFPNNPTGAVATTDLLQQIVGLCAEHNLYLISDEVYSRIIHDGHEHVGAGRLRNKHEGIIVVNSFSKTYAMTGWRIGWMAGPADFISQALKALQNSITNLPPFIQMGALTALTNRTVSKAADMMAAKYTQRRDLAQEIIRQAGLRIMPPQGAFYLFLDFRDLCVDSSTMAKEILEEQKVCTVPGSVYGQCGEGFLRVSLSVPDDVLFEGLKRIVRWYDGKQTRASYPSQRSMSCA